MSHFTRAILSQSYRRSMIQRAANPTPPSKSTHYAKDSAPIDFDAAAKAGTPVTIDHRALEWSSNAGSFANPFSQKALGYAALGLGLGLIALNVTKPYTEDKRFVIDPEFVKMRSGQTPQHGDGKVQLSFADMKALSDYEALTTQYQLGQKLPQARAKHDEYINDLRREQEQRERENDAKSVA